MAENSKGRRTTLTLDKDVSDALREKMRTVSHLKEKTLINELLRKGLEQTDAANPSEFIIVPFETELAPGVTPEMIKQMLKQI
jgi:signal transduction histidine kinase